MPERKRLTTWDRTHMSESELKDAYFKARGELYDVLGATLFFDRPLLEKWYDEVAMCWRNFALLHRELAARWKHYDQEARRGNKNA